MGSRHHLCILVWKHLKERRHRLRHTIWEITSGVLVFVVLLLMKKVVKELIYSEYSYIQGLNAVLFSPNTLFTQEFMRKATIRMTQTQSNRTDGADNTHFSYVRGFYSEEELHDYMRHVNFPVAKIIFKNLNRSVLDYSIGIVDHDKHAHEIQRSLDKASQNTRRIQLLSEPVTRQDSILPALAHLQWEIDKTFIESVAGNNITHNLVIPLNDQFINPMTIVHQFLVLCTVAAPLPFFLYNSSRLSDEKRSGMKELMKIENVSPNILRLSHLVDTAIMATIYATLITSMLKGIKISASPILPHSNGAIIGVTIVLYFMNITSLAFVTNTLSDNYEHANSLALVIYIATCAGSYIWHSQVKDTPKVFVACWFLPHAAIFIFWDEVNFLERIGQGTRFYNLLHQHGPNCTPVPFAWAIFLTQLIFIMMLTWYLDLVIPGVYGLTLPWNFLFKRQFWCRNRKRVHFHVTSERSRKLLRDDRFYEQGPVKIPIIIKLIDVTKIYNSLNTQIKALESVSFDVFRGEITVVLGTNGAGKTTLSSIIAGMTHLTRGSVYVYGYDNFHRIHDVRQFIGLCPQHHLTFDYLTVRENIIFFQKLSPKSDSISSPESLMATLHLQDQADRFSHELSSGAERCLQLACTLAGGAEVLILDEPTANCDATTRHHLWDVILGLRGTKTILMTTSSIEEADVLGDRIALLNQGRLRCYGTSMFLKKAIGTGFNLTVTTTKNTDLQGIRSAVVSTLPTATCNIDTGRVIFTLPAKDYELFPILFTRLENNKEELGIASIDMGMSMEEMFLGFVEDTADDDEAIFVTMFHDVDKLTGWRLRLQQLWTLMKREFLQLWSNKYQFIILQVLVPVLGLIVLTVASNRTDFLISQEGDIVMLSLKGRNLRTDDIDYVTETFPKLKIIVSLNNTKDYGNIPHGHPNQVFGIRMDADQSDLCYPMYSQKDLTKAVNIFSNMFMTLNQYPRRRNIRTDYIMSETPELDIVKPKEQVIIYLWAMWVTFIITVPLTPYIGMLARERSTGMRLTFFVVGCSYALQWLAKLLFHSIVFLLIIPPALLLSIKFCDRENTLNQDGFLRALLVAQLCFLPAFLLQLYVLSFFLNERHATSQIYIMSMAMGFSGPFIHLLLEALGSTEKNALLMLMLTLNLIGDLSPVFTLSESLTNLVNVASVKAFCKYNKRHCVKLTADEQKYKKLYALCCRPDKLSYEYLDDYFLVHSLAIFLCQTLLYSMMLTLLKNRCLQSVFDKLFNYQYHSPPKCDGDMDVAVERARVQQLMKYQSPPEGVFLAKELHKKYLNCRKSGRTNAVRGVSFKVERGECLAILGPNEAGKTSILRMIASRIPATRGDCGADGVTLRRNRSKYAEKIAKIKDKLVLDEFYTGSENVTLLCLLRGYHQRHAEIFALNWMAYMGLQRYTHTLYGAISPGCSRRIGLCAALLADRFAVLVDEPMRSVDPHARPLVKRALTRLRDKGCALVVAEKSLDWLELDSLASRIAVLSKGQIVTIGSSHHIRSIFANGHTARLKIKLRPVMGLTTADSASDLEVFDSSKVTKKKGLHKSVYNLAEARRYNEAQNALEKARDALGTSTAYDESRSELSEAPESEQILSIEKELELETEIITKEVVELKNDFKIQFPTSELAEEHLSVLYFQIKGDNAMPYSEMFSKLQGLKKTYDDILEDFTLSQISLEDMYGRLAKES